MRRVRLVGIAAGTALLAGPAAANADVVAVSPAVSGPIVTGLIAALACAVLVVVIAAVLIIRRMVRRGALGTGDTTQGVGYMADQSLTQGYQDPVGYAEDANRSDADSGDAGPSDSGSRDAGPSDDGSADSGGGSWDSGGDFSGSSDSTGGAE